MVLGYGGPGKRHKHSVSSLHKQCLPTVCCDGSVNFSLICNPLWTFSKYNDNELLEKENLKMTYKTQSHRLGIRLNRHTALLWVWLSRRPHTAWNVSTGIEGLGLKASSRWWAEPSTPGTTGISLSTLFPSSVLLWNQAVGTCEKLVWGEGKKFENGR